MRTLGATLTAAQQSKSYTPSYNIVLTKAGQTTRTYTQTRIKHMVHTEQQDNFTATVVLDNSDAALTALNLKGYKGVISYGLNAVYGTDPACASLKVIEQREDSSPGKLTVTLYLEGVPNQMARDEANDDFQPMADDPSTIAGIIGVILVPTTQVFPDWENNHVYGAAFIVPPTSNGFFYYTVTGGTSGGSEPTWPTTLYKTVVDGGVTWWCWGHSMTTYSHCTSYSPSAQVVSTVTPANAFHISLRDSRLDKLNELLGYTGYVMLPQGDAVTFLAPTVSGTTYAYEYNLTSGHTFFQKAYTQRLALPNRADVASMPDDDTQYTGTYSGADNSIMDVRTFRRIHLASNAEAVTIATAIVTQSQLARSQGQGVVPMNCGQEVFDYIKITDPRGNNVTGNVSYIQREAGPGIYRMVIGLGGIRMGGLPVPHFVVPTGVPAKATPFDQFYEWFCDIFWVELDKTLEDYRVKINSLIEQVNSTKTTTSGIVFVIDGGGSAIATGQKGHLKIPFDCILTAVEVEADVSGSIVVDIWKDTYANFPPTVANTICGATKPTITTAQKMQDTDITDWLRSIAAGDILAFNVDSCTTITRVTITLTAERQTI